MRDGQMAMIYRGFLVRYMGAILLHLTQCLPMCNNLDIVKWIPTWLECIYVGIAGKGRGIDLNFDAFSLTKKVFHQPFDMYL